MATPPLNAKAVFDEAVEIASPKERRAYLDRACADAPALRQQVEALLAAYADAGSFLESPPPPPRDTMDLRPAAERPGTTMREGGQERRMTTVRPGRAAPVAVLFPPHGTFRCPTSHWWVSARNSAGAVPTTPAPLVRSGKEQRATFFQERSMATRLVSNALATASLGMALSLLLAATGAPSPAWGNTAGAPQLDPPAAPSRCKSTNWFYDRRERETYASATWIDNSTNEDGFTLEAWWRNQSGAWVLAWSVNKPANSTGEGFVFSGRQSPYKFRVKAFNAAGDSAWSNWGR